MKNHFIILPLILVGGSVNPCWPQTMQQSTLGQTDPCVAIQNAKSKLKAQKASLAELEHSLLRAEKRHSNSYRIALTIGAASAVYLIFKLHNSQNYLYPREMFIPALLKAALANGAAYSWYSVTEWQRNNLLEKIQIQRRLFEIEERQLASEAAYYPDCN